MDATESEIIGFCKEAMEYSFHAMLAFPRFIDVANKALKDSEVKLETS